MKQSNIVGRERQEGCQRKKSVSRSRVRGDEGEDSDDVDDDSGGSGDGGSEERASEGDCRGERKGGEVAVEVEIELEVVATRKVIEGGEYKEAEGKRKRWVEANRDVGKKEERG